MTKYLVTRATSALTARELQLVQALWIIRAVCVAVFFTPLVIILYFAVDPERFSDDPRSCSVAVGMLAGFVFMVTTLFYERLQNLNPPLRRQKTTLHD